MVRNRTWPVRLSTAAEADFEDIVRWTTERFGATQARTYAATLTAAIEALAEGPSVSGVKTRDDIAEGLFTLHAARGGQRARHFVIFRIGRERGRDVIDVLRLLHDAMDLPSHVPSE